jgi:integrase
MAKGIEERHSRSCRMSKGGRCDCEPTFRAWVWDGEKRVRYSTSSLTEAQQWRHDARIALRRGRRPQGRNVTTLQDAAAEWTRLAGQGVVRTSKGELYKPATLRTFDQHLRQRVLDRFGDEPLADLTRPDWQGLVDDLLADGSAAATVGATVAAVSAVYRFEVSRGRLKSNPLRELDLPTADNGRERVVSPAQASALLSALPEAERALWATATYAGLRRGELRALRVSDVDLAAGVIRVHFGWDEKQGRQPTKGRGRRNVPIPSLLAKLLREHLMRSGRREDELLFGSTAFSPFSPQAVQRRADTAWNGLERVTLHECRHTYASYMIASGCNIKAVSTYMGHASIAITLDTYAHLLPGSEEEAAGLLDDYLSKAVGS